MSVFANAVGERALESLNQQINSGNLNPDELAYAQGVRDQVTAALADVETGRSVVVLASANIVRGGDGNLTSGYRNTQINIT